MASPGRGSTGRPGDHLINPDDQSVAANECDGERRHDDGGQKKERKYFEAPLTAGAIRWLLQISRHLGLIGER
jgi:hypothetical protein